MKIKCNDCNFIGQEDDLEILEDNKSVIKTEYFKGCPNCKTDSFLMDVEKD
jgi:Pyruvate/2-oxoacid:ferredoxin oxidoreductase delta subunit